MVYDVFSYEFIVYGVFMDVSSSDNPLSDSIEYM